MTYTKLDAGITDSTIWQAPDTTRLVWITMLAMADQNGYVGASMPGLAGRARVALDACVEAVKTLESPDEWSRTKEHEGRRVAPADGGWVLLNHDKYRAKQNADDRRERSRIAMAELRANRKRAATPVNGEQPLTVLALGSPKLSQAEAEALNTSEAKASAVPAQAAVKDAAAMTKAELWTAGKSLLLEAGVPKAQCGSFVGKLVADYTDTVVIEAVRAAVMATPADPKEYLKAACMRMSGERKDAPTVAHNPQVEQTQQWIAQQDEAAANATPPPSSVLALRSKRPEAT